MTESKVLSQKLIAKLFLVLWVGAVIFVYIIVYWPPVLWMLADAMGISESIVGLQLLIKPFFTAPYRAGFGG